MARTMWSYHPDLLATPVPRYTSFPTAAEFGDGVGADDFAAALDTTSGDISLYIHIPYCQSICWYCGCNTGAANRRHRLESYLDGLHREIALVGQRLRGRTRVRRVAFGGGSPNAITPTDFVRLAEALTLNFHLDDPLWSVELDPRTLPPEWGEVLAEVGIRNASMGVQTFAPHLQQAIGRIQPEADIARGVELLRRAGVESLNFDLMYGLPGQTTDDLAYTLERTVHYGADRVALFGYAHVPHMIPRQQRIDASALPDQAARFAMAWQGYEWFTGHGYDAVGFDHFALPGDPMARAVREGTLHRNFQGFTEDSADVLVGLGASAISAFPTLLAQNEKNAGRYRMILSQDRLAVTHGVACSAEDRLRGAVIEAMLCRGEATVPADLMREGRARLEAFAQRGVVAIDGDKVTITADGLPYARSVAAIFDPYRQDSARRFSSAV